MAYLTLIFLIALQRIGLPQSDLGNMSLEELLRVEVTIPDKLSTSMKDVSSQIYVIDHQQIELHG